MSISVDTILQRMIVDARNLDPSINISQGTDTYIRFATTASAIWGLYKQLDWTVDQIFPSTMSKESLERFATERGKSVDNLTGAELLSFVISYLRKPPSGGKDTDYERWALETVSNGEVLPLTASMFSGNIPFDGAALVDPKNKDSVGFAVGTPDVGKSLIIDLGGAKSVFGIGLGFITSRGAEFRVYSAEGEGAERVLRAVINADHWNMDTFKAVEARFWIVELYAIDNLEDWQIPERNMVKCHGIEFYTNEDSLEQPGYAKTIKKAYGAGTMAVLLAPVSLSMRLIESVREHCEDEGPVAPKEIFVSVQRETPISLKVIVDGIGDLNESSFKSDVQRYFNELQTGDIFVAAQIVVFAIKNGAKNAEIKISVNGGEYEDIDVVPGSADQKFILGELIVE